MIIYKVQVKGKELTKRFKRYYWTIYLRSKVGSITLVHDLKQLGYRLQLVLHHSFFVVAITGFCVIFCMLSKKLLFLMSFLSICHLIDVFHLPVAIYVLYFSFSAYSAHPFGPFSLLSSASCLLVSRVVAASFNTNMQFQFNKMK